MHTKYIKIENDIDSAADHSGIRTAAEILLSGGLVAVPTETVYGLAANALDAAAVEKIFRAKGRPQDNPLIVHIHNFSQMDELISELDPRVFPLAEAFWPGPLTVVLPKSALVPEEVSGGLSTVAIRMPAHPAARAILEAAGIPLAAPSANRSGSPSPTTAQHVLADLDGRIDAVVDAGPCAVGLESTVLALTEERPRLLRPGGVSPEQLEAVLGPVQTDPAVYAALPESAAAPSPGMKYKHYAPRAKVILVKASSEQYAAYVKARAAGSVALCFTEDLPALSPAAAIAYGGERDAEEQAHKLFAALRRVDEMGAETAYVHCPATEGLGLAVYNRLLRAAAFQIVEL